MNAAERKRFKSKLYNSYHPTGKSAHYRVKKNVLCITPYPSATLEHELCKFLFAYLDHSNCNADYLFPLFLERIPKFVKGIDYKSTKEKGTNDYWTEGVENATGLRRDYTSGENGRIREFETDKKRALKDKGEGYTVNTDIYEIPK